MNFPTKIGTDENGYILNFASKDKIMPQYLVILEKLIDLLIENIKDKIHSIYIYGSVGRGTAIWGESDIDLTIVLYSKLSEVEVKKLDEAKKNFY